MGKKIIRASDSPKQRLLADRILIEVEEFKEKKSIGGIIIPGTVERGDMAQFGVIKAISNRVAAECIGDENVEVGMTATFSKYGGSDIEFDSHRGKKYKIMRITDVFGIDETEPAN